MVFDTISKLIDEEGLVPVKQAVKRKEKEMKEATRTKRQKTPWNWVAQAYAKQKGMCAWCNKYMPSAVYPDCVGDHIISLDEGGRHHKNNIQGMHKKCNEEKSNKSLNRISKQTGKTYLEQIGPKDHIW